MVGGSFNLRPAAVSQAGIAYGAAMFGAGFLLGSMRVFLLAPNLGDALAVLLELPVILGFSWAAAAWLVRRWRLTAREALLAGALGFVTLLACEAALAVALFGQTVEVWASGLLRFPAVLGLVGQLFAGFLLYLVRH